MNRSYNFIVPFLLVFIIAMSEMATAIYTPCLPAVARHFAICEEVAQWTVSINLFGLALSGPVYGPWSDACGRRGVLRWGMGLFLLGSVFSWLAGSIDILLASRLIQGLGAGVAVVVSFAVVRDLFDEKKSAQVLSYMGMAIALSPGLAPIAGSYIGHHHGWTSCFGVVSVGAALVMLALMFWMPETLPDEKRTLLSVKSVARGYGQAFKNKRFLALSMIPSLMIGGIWIWMAALPVLFISYLGVSIQDFGYYGFSGVACYVVGAYVNSKIVSKYSLKSLLMLGLLLCLAGSVFLLVAGLKDVSNPMILQGVQFPFALGLAFILPNGTSLAFSQVREGLGTSSALLGSFEMALGGMGVFLMGALFHGTIIPIASLMLGCTLLSLLLYTYVNRSLRSNESS